MKYTWKLWKRGAVVAGITGLVSAGGAWALATQMNLKATIALFVGMVAKDMLLYLNQHPAGCSRHRSESFRKI